MRKAGCARRFNPGSRDANIHNSDPASHQAASARCRISHAPGAWLQRPRHPGTACGHGHSKGLVYHHFKDKEDFALRIIDQYMTHVHAGLDACLDDSSRLPLERVRRFFELTQRSYRKEGYMGCLLGGLGQELSGVSERFRRRIEACFSEIAVRIATCLEQAKQRGDIPADSDTRQMASLLVDCWEGAALRSRLRGNAAPLKAMLDFYFNRLSRADRIVENNACERRREQ